MRFIFTDFISGMAEGVGSWIAQGGTNVSGGQKQRLSIARALVRQPEITTRSRTPAERATM